MITTMSDSLTVGVQQLQQLSSERSSVPGVQADTRGAKEGELGPRLQQQRQGSEVVSCAISGAWYCGAILHHCKLLSASAPPFPPLPAAASARPLPAPLGGAGAGRGWLNGTMPHWGRRHM